MAQRRRRRNAVALLLFALTCGAVSAAPVFDPLETLSVDVLTSLRQRLFPPAHPPEASPTVVIALDEETYRTKPFAGAPTIAWTGEIGKVIAAAHQAGAAVIGFDVVFAASLEQAEIPFGDDTVGARLRGFDREFLRALAGLARADALVLGQAQHQAQPIAPTRGQALAVGGAKNIRSLNLIADADDVVRRAPLRLNSESGPQPSMALELATRALGRVPAAAIPTQGADADSLRLNIHGGSDAIPTYSLADLRACLAAGRSDFFQQAFAGKVVLLGATLDVEDRKLTPLRFAASPAVPGPRCVTPPPPPERFARRTMPGVYVHAAAVNNLLRDDALTGPSWLGRAALAVAAAGCAGAAALVLSPPAAFAALAALAALWLGGGTLAMRAGWATPLFGPMLAALAAQAMTIAWRMRVADRDRRLLRQSFALYLAPSLIDRMLASDKPPELGGETRTVTIFFSDLVGFSSMAETMSPAALTALMNAYLTAMTDVIEAHGGFVDKYVGDAIVAVFGAPLDDPNHAAQAVRAALACQTRLAALNAQAPELGGHRLVHRIGLNTGPALVGNIGSKRRFNYTVMGDTVNLASRLEGANKYLGSTLCAAAETVAAAPDVCRWRELDALRVSGRAEPEQVFEPIDSAAVDAALGARLEIYAQGLACWRRRDFTHAAALFGQIAAHDPAAALFLEQVEEALADPPGPDWAPVRALDGK